MEMHKPVIENHGLHANHDMACAVCHKNKAVIMCETEVFFPCWSCQKDGYRLINLSAFSRFKQWLFNLI